MKKFFSINLLVPLGFFTVCLMWLKLSLDLPRASSVTTFAGPSTFPTVVLVIMLISAIIVTVQEAIAVSKANEGETIEKWDLIRIISLLALVTVYVFILELVGFIISTILLMIAAIILFGQKNKILCIAVPAGMTLFIYFVFQFVLKINLP